MIRKSCPICGREFAAISNKKYCSEACRIEGAKRARKSWRVRTGYNETQREKMRAYRQALADEKNAAQAEADARRQAEAERRRKEAAEIRKQKLKERAATGYPSATMLLYSKQSPNYWQAFKEYELQFAASLSNPKPATACVNGISIYDDHFANEVIRSIKERNMIYISH